MKTLELTQRQQQLSLDTLHEETARYLARMGITTTEIADNFNKTNINIEMLMNRTEELAATYRIRADVGNAITTLENLGTIAGDLPHLVHSINMSGVVHPAYVPQAVWQEARTLLRHDEHARKLWLPESRGTNATWFHRNQTLRVEVPASCSADPAVNFIKKELTHLNTSLVLRFSAWTDAQILQTEQLQKLREHARAAAARIEAERRRNAFFRDEDRDVVALASLGSAGVLLLCLLGICVGFVCVFRRRPMFADYVQTYLAPRSAPEHKTIVVPPPPYLSEARVPEPHERAKDDVDYEPVPPPQSEGIYPNSAAFVTSHALNTRQLRGLHLDSALLNHRIQAPEPAYA
jgi:hypothetical protein